MTMLYLDQTFTVKNCDAEIKFNGFTFPGGEQHVKLGQDLNGWETWIATRLTHGDSFMRLAVAADAVRRAGGIPCAFIPYLPYARQDRVMVPGEPFSLGVFATLLNSLKLFRVRIYDPHSDVATAVVNNVEVIDSLPFIKFALGGLAGFAESLCIVSPDAGSLKRIYGLLKRLPEHNLPLAVGSKVRDVNTGAIVRQSVDGDVSGKTCLIVDDIIDGGRTFQDLAALLRERGAERVYLAVSHGIFSQGTKHLRGPLDGIFVTNSFRDMNGSQDVGFVHQYQLGFNG